MPSYQSHLRQTSHDADVDSERDEELVSEGEQQPSRKEANAIAITRVLADMHKLDAALHNGDNYEKGPLLTAQQILKQEFDNLHAQSHFTGATYSPLQHETAFIPAHYSAKAPIDEELLSNAEHSSLPATGFRSSYVRELARTGYLYSEYRPNAIRKTENAEFDSENSGGDSEHLSKWYERATVMLQPLLRELHMFSDEYVICRVKPVRYDQANP